MARPIVEVSGLKQLRKTLRQAGDDMGDLKAANLEAATIVAKAANPPVKDGLLAGSIRPAGTKTAGIVRAGKKSVPYGGPVHWGWPAKNIAAQPFLTDAATRTEPQWVGIYQRRIEEITATIEGV